MLIELTEYLRRHGLTVRDFVKQQKIHTYSQILNYCQRRELQPIAESDFNLILKDMGGVAKPKKVSAKTTKNVVQKTKAKTRTTRRKSTRNSKTPTKES